MISSVWTYLASFWKANAGTALAAADRVLRDHQEQHDPVVDAAREVFAGSATIVPAPAVRPAATPPAAGWRGPRPSAEPEDAAQISAPPAAAAVRRSCRADGLGEGRVLELLVEKSEELGSPLAAAQYLFHPREDA
ncbi:hypothetical protein AB0O28_19030 [Microbispora sp. NPDC088329]|uniref:hypothetical protein n=1 Tax=Microbispora sp. NPDC088329 TaxID=3154869 RepID=UPI0034377D63